MFGNFFFVLFFENRAVYEVMWKKNCRDRQDTRKYDACALRAGYLRV